MGKASRDKGARFEREVVRAVQATGLVCYRVAGSGALASRVQSKTAAATLRDDVVIELEDGREIRVECKIRKSLPKYLKPWRLFDCGANPDVSVEPEHNAINTIQGIPYSDLYAESPRKLPGYLKDWLSSTGVVCMRANNGSRMWVFREDWREMQWGSDAE